MLTVLLLVGQLIFGEVITRSVFRLLQGDWLALAPVVLMTYACTRSYLLHLFFSLSLFARYTISLRVKGLWDSCCFCCRHSPPEAYRIQSSTTRKIWYYTVVIRISRASRAERRASMPPPLPPILLLMRLSPLQPAVAPHQELPPLFWGWGRECACLVTRVRTKYCKQLLLTITKIIYFVSRQLDNREVETSSCASLHSFLFCSFLLSMSMSFLVLFAFYVLFWFFLSFCRFFALFSFSCSLSRWNFEDVPRIFSCPTHHVTPRILLRMVEARSVKNVNNTHTHTH